MEGGRQSDLNDGKETESDVSIENAQKAPPNHNASNIAADNNENEPNQRLENYTVDWKRITPLLIELLQSGNREYTYTQRLVQEIMGQLFFLNGNQRVGVDTLKRVAIQVYSKFPEAIEDRYHETGEKIREGYTSFLNKLICRNKNEGRKPDQENLSKKLKNPLSKEKLLRAVKSGCVDWMPKCFPPDENEKSLRIKQKDLKNYRTMLKDPEHKNKVELFLRKTYCLQRLFLNDMEKPKTITDIMNEWPILLQHKAIMIHFCLLTGRDKEDIFEKFENNISTLLAFGDVSRTLSLEKSKSYTKAQKLLESINVICRHFVKEKDQLENIFSTIPVSIEQNFVLIIIVILWQLLITC